MGIRLDPEAVDAQGLPVVTWEEDRNLFAPGGISPARVACFIRPNEKGELQFVSVGSVRHGEYEEARPWEKLVSLGMGTAEQHYHSAGERALIDIVASKSKSGAGRLLAADGAQVMLANFADARPSVAMHLNCAEALPVEVAQLHDVLSREFIRKRPDLVRRNLRRRICLAAREALCGLHAPCSTIRVALADARDRSVDCRRAGFDRLVGLRVRFAIGSGPDAVARCRAASA